MTEVMNKLKDKDLYNTELQTGGNVPLSLVHHCSPSLISIHVGPIQVVL